MSVNTATMKKSDTLVVFSSPHAHGNTRMLLDAFLQQERITDFVLFDCYKRQPKPCMDCGCCAAEFRCIFDDLDDFYRALNGCTRIIIAAPVYNNGFSAPMKALLDRMQIYFNARFKRNVRPPIKVAKQADILLTSGSNADCETAVLAQILPCFTVLNTTFGRLVHVGGLDFSTDVASDIAHALADTKKNLSEDEHPSNFSTEGRSKDGV